MYNTVNKRLSFKILLLISICLMLFFFADNKAAYAAAGTIYESEPNNTYSTADLTYDDYDNYGYISTTSDVDWWKVKFNSSGSANFWLGNVPSGCDYDLRVYSSNGTTLLRSSTNNGNANELITINVNANVYYYIRINSFTGYSSSLRYLFRAKLYPDQTPVYVDEREPNDTYTIADITTDDADKYGCIGYASDVDWWRVKFNSSGVANFYLGNIPSGCDYELYLYSSNGTTLLRSSTNSGNANELITYNVSANTFYYMKITSHYGYSTSSPYLLRAKLYPTKTISSVPLYQQEYDDTCGPSCAIMILKSYGITVSESDFKYKAWSLSAWISEGYTDRRYITEAINHYLSSINTAPTYKHTYIGHNSHNVNSFKDMMWRNIANNHPVQILMAIDSANSYFPYTTKGHYLVLKGIGYNQSDGYTAILNDPHNKVGKATRTVPMGETWTRINDWDIYNTGSYIIHVED